MTLVGEPGIGKTRTAQELATYAGLRSAQVLWGRCYEEQGMPPYWPWVQAIRSYVREHEPEQLRSEMGAGAADIAEVVSDIKERLPDLKPPPQLDSPEQARFRLFDSITSFLKTASQKQPLVLVLDDLHWADQPSLLLLQFVARELGNSRLLLIGTYRDMELSRQHPLAESLGELTRERLFQRVLLRGLSQQDVGRFIEVAAGVEPPAGLTQAVHTQTEGNPLFVTEVVRLLVQEGELTAERTRDRDSWTVRIPEGVREVIGRRLNRLSQRCNETLTISSIIGREFELRQLGPLVEDMSEDRLLEVLEEALAARVIEELPQAVGRYQFTHALIQETLIEELTTTRRVRLHSRIAEALELMYGDSAEAHAAELAHHFAEAESVLGTEKLVHYSLLAGERALAAYAWEEALAHFRRALAAKEGRAIDAETAALLFGLGRSGLSVLELDQMPTAFAYLSRAFDYYVEADDVDQAVAIAEYPLPMYLVIGHELGVSELIARALELVPPDSRQAGRLFSHYGLTLYFETADHQGAQEAFTRALAMAQQQKDVGLEMRTLVNAANVDFYDLRPEEAVEKALRATELARLAEDTRMEVHARYYAAAALILNGSLERAKLEAAALLAVTERLGDRFWLAGALWMNERIAQHLGDWQLARTFSDSGLASSPRDFRLLSARVLLEYEVGEFGQGAVYLDQLLKVVPLTSPGPSVEKAMMASAIATVARIASTSHYLDISEGAGQSVVSSDLVTPIIDRYARAALGLVAVERRDGASAAKQYGAFVSLRHAWFHFVAGDHLLGLLAHTMGHHDKAVEHFEDMLALCRKADYRPELAWTCCDYADTLLQRNEPGDRERAMSLLDESLAISSELGMRPLMERVLSRREILKA